MPPLIRRYIKTSFAFLIAGLILGAALFVINMWARVRMPSITPVK